VLEQLRVCHVRCCNKGHLVYRLVGKECEAKSEQKASDVGSRVFTVILHRMSDSLTERCRGAKPFALDHPAIWPMCVEISAFWLLLESRRSESFCQSAAIALAAIKRLVLISDGDHVDSSAKHVMSHHPISTTVIRLWGLFSAQCMTSFLIYLPGKPCRAMSNTL
jgi:hypothetical protein